MIGLDRKFQHIPSAFRAFVPDETFTIHGNLSRKHGLASPRAPNEVVHDEMDTVFVSLVLHSRSFVEIGL